jgi:hypothetical protein
MISGGINEMSNSVTFLTQESTSLSNRSSVRKAPLAPHLQSNEMEVSPLFSTSSISQPPVTTKSKRSSKKSRSSSSKLLKTTVLTFVNEKKQPTMNSIDERYIFVGSDLNSIESAQSSTSSSTSSSSSISYLSSLQCSNITKNPIRSEDDVPINEQNNDSNTKHDEKTSCDNCNCPEELTDFEFQHKDDNLNILDNTNYNAESMRNDDLNQTVSSVNSSKNVPKPKPRSIYVSYDDCTNEEKNSNNQVS